MPRRRWLPLLAGFALAVVTVGLLLVLLSRTERGREQVLRYTLTAVGGRLNGVLSVERLDGDLFTGARLFDISLQGLDGEPLLDADSAYIEYRLASFVGGDVVINHLTLFGSRVSLLLLPGDTLWNYQHILSDTSGAGDPSMRATLIERLRLVDSDVTVRLPWEPDRDLSPAERQREIAAALTDTSRLVVSRVPGGLLRTLRFEVEEARLAELFISSDERGGTYLRVDSAKGDAYIWQEPALRVHDVRGDLTVREGVVRYNAPLVTLPESRLETAGVVRTRGDDDEIQFDIVVAGERIAFRDMHWLYPRFPEQGGGGLRLWMETQPEGVLFRAEEVQLETPGTRLRGRFGMLMGDTVRFVDTELEADPLDVGTVERMLPDGLPVRGLRIGAAEIRTPRS